MKLRKKKNIKDATNFKVQYALCGGDKPKYEEREFKSIKSMQQWISRNDNEFTFGILILRMMALINGEWEAFTTIGKKTITLTNLKHIVEDLDYDAFNSSTAEK